MTNKKLNEYLQLTPSAAVANRYLASFTVLEFNTFLGLIILNGGT